MAKPTKLDLFKQHKEEYAAPGRPTLVSTKPALYMTATGQGAPGGDMFVRTVGALYAMAYTVKMSRKLEGGPDYVVSKLEALLWCDRPHDDMADVPQEQWRWQLMLRTPEFVTAEDLAGAAAKLMQKGKGAGVEKVLLKPLDEGRCVQMLHVGPYAREHESVLLIQEFMARNELIMNGRHHEIYLSDPRRIPPERLKTILRWPVRPRQTQGASA